MTQVWSLEAQVRLMVGILKALCSPYESRGAGLESGDSYMTQV